MDIIDHKYDDDVVLQKRWWYFPTKVCWQSENGRISNLVQLPSFEQLAVGKSAWGNYSATDEQSSQRPKLSTLTISCVTIVTSSKQLRILSAQSAHVAFEGLTQFSQSSLESGFFKRHAEEGLGLPRVGRFLIRRDERSPCCQKNPKWVQFSGGLFVFRKWPPLRSIDYWPTAFLVAKAV